MSGPFNAAATARSAGSGWPVTASRSTPGSAGRAEATRQALRGRGIAESRFERIEGVAEREPLVPEDPADPRNRRMSLLVVD